MNSQELLLTKVRNCRRIDLYVDSKPLSREEEGKLTRMNHRLSQGEPLQYILGTTEFMGLEFRVDPRVLIPRPETELLVELALETLSKKSNQHLNILEIGVGSGSISVSLAKHLPNSQIIAIDISQDALDLALVNAKINNVEDKIDFLRSDVFSKLSCGPEQAKRVEGFDLIISNPPYIRTADLALLPQDVKHEPRVALDGGADGLVFYRRIITESKNFLKPGGYVIFEMGDGQKPAIEKIFQESGHFKIIEVRKDYRQTDRIIAAELTNHG